MRDMLFEMGVFDDDDRTKREKALPPVRCLEEELLPPVPMVAKCVHCDYNHSIKDRDICIVCVRKNQLGIKKKRRDVSDRMTRLRTAMICRGGFMVETSQNARLLDDFVSLGHARWATKRDLLRLGVNQNHRVAILL